MSGRPYPDEPAGPFPRPPRAIEDACGARIEFARVDRSDSETVSDLLAMYEAFDPADRAQGIPPQAESAIREWVDLVLSRGPDVVARHDGTIVGHATLVPEDETGAHELAIFVLDGYQGRGIGSALLATLLGAAQADGIEFVWLTVERFNRRAVALYESVGFESTGGGNFDLEMTLRL